MRTTHLLTVSHSSPGVGCLPGVVCQGGLCVHPGGCVSRGRMFGVCVQGVCGLLAMWPVCGLLAMWPVQGTLGYTATLPRRGQTDTCKNITFLPQLLLWAVKMSFCVSNFPHQLAWWNMETCHRKYMRKAPPCRPINWWELPGSKAISFIPGCETFVGILDSLKQTLNSLESSEIIRSKSS